MKAGKIVVAMVVIVLFGATLPAKAADYPTSELFAGFRYTSFGGQANGFGWGGSWAYNFHQNFGLAAELGGVYGSSGGTSFTFHDVLVGPRVTLRGNQFNVFAHVLGGGGFVTASGIGAGSGFVFAAGGGLDYNVSKTLALRLAQVDYLGLTGGGVLSSIRAQTGVVFRFGN